MHGDGGIVRTHSCRCMSDGMTGDESVVTAAEKVFPRPAVVPPPPRKRSRLRGVVVFT